MPDVPGEITRLLIAYRQGDPDALSELVPLVYGDLRRIARSQLRRRESGRTLSTTALVHEAYLRLANLTRLSWRDRAHFYAVAAVAMRRVIVDYARERSALKRGGGRDPVALDDLNDLADVRRRAAGLVALDDALGRLEHVQPALARVVECRFFAGYSEEETAEALGVSLRTVQRAWSRARAWLKVELGGASQRQRQVL